MPGLVPAADWLQVRILLPGGPLVHHPGDVSSHRMTLDMRRGALLSEGRHVEDAATWASALRTLRLVSLSERAIGLQLIQLEIEDGRGRGHARSVVRRAWTSGSYPNGSSRISACGAPSIRASASPWRPRRRCRSTATIFRRPRSAN